MIVVLQRVARASVTVEGGRVGAIERGLLLLLGVHQNDDSGCADVLAAKCAELRVFADAEGKMNRSAAEIGGAALVVSQFTLCGECKKGRRPNFMAAAAPEKGRALYEHFVSALRQRLAKVETGVFGAMMKVELVNDGPVTLILEKHAEASPTSKPPERIQEPS